jgi:formylmethanofuran dehydrogenase subunit B
MPATAIPTVITDVACTVCGCVCDDLTIHVENIRIVRAEHACWMAEPWFLGQNADLPPVASVDGDSCDLATAIEAAASILRESRSPLIYGLSRSTTEGQRAAVALAEYIGGTIDTTASTGHAPSLMALQQVGESTCSLGEVRNRADLVIYWASDPLVSHPRHLERYVRATNRHVIVVGRDDNETARVADEHISMTADDHVDALGTLRGIIAGVLPDEGVLGRLARRMKECRCGIIFFGNGLTRGPLGHRQVEALLQLVTDLNQHTRFYARRMRRLGDVAGADSVLTWQTGYPFAVNFARGYPIYNPGEFSGPAMLARGEVDACLFVGSETAVDFPPEAVEQLRHIPVIALESPATRTIVDPAVRITTAVYGIHRSGTAYRMDEIPIPLRALLPTDYPSDGEVLSALLQRLSPGGVGGE